MCEKCVTVNDLIEALHIDPISAEELLNGIIEFDLHELYELAEHTGVDIATLMEEFN